MDHTYSIGTTLGVFDIGKDDARRILRNVRTRLTTDAPHKIRRSVPNNSTREFIQLTNPWEGPRLYIHGRRLSVSSRENGQGE